MNISQIKGHLALLHAFAELKKQVEGLEDFIPQMPADLKIRWAWFVALAVERSVSTHSSRYSRIEDILFFAADLTFGAKICDRRMWIKVWK